MGQEDTEKEIGSDCLRTIVKKAIKTKNICDIETIKDEHKLRYMQKYAELLVSKDDSIKSFSFGIYGIIIFSFTVGLSYYLVSISDNQRLWISNVSIFYLITSILLFLWMLYKIKEFKDNIEFIHEIILKIEEKLANKT